MNDRTLKNDVTTPRAKNLSYNPLQWAQDFEKELLESNREVFLSIYNTDVEEYWLETDNE